MNIKELVGRDGPNCGLCKQPVDLSAEYPHPLSATIGHIIPKARGGNDEPNNLRLEHRECNSRKFTSLDEELSEINPPNPKLSPEVYAAATERLKVGARKGGINCPLEARIRGGVGYHKKLKGTLEYAVHRSKAGNRRIELHGCPSTPEGCSKGGVTTGKMNAESGHLARISSLGVKADGPGKATHKRYHVNRGIINPNCKYCRAMA